jgi:nonsense-mediated mRNA decay protein 3
MAFCLKKVKGLDKVKLVDSDFIWTEAHSKRIKIRVKIQREVQNNLSLESTLMIEFTEKNFQCDDCKKTWTPNKWKAIVQLRQKANTKQTILFLEQLIMKHGMHKKTSNIKEMPDGLDFCFANKALAEEFASFIQSQIITKTKQSKQLISADLSSYEYNYVYTFSIELPSISKGDLIIIPPKLQRELGGASSLCLVLKVASLIHLFDPVKVKVHTLDSKCYWNYELLPVCTRSQLREYVVKSIGSSIGASAEYSFANFRLQRVSDPDEVFKTFRVKSHLGKILKTNDKVLAYDLSVITNGELEVKKIPELDVVVVKKSYQHKGKKHKLKRLDKEKVPGKKESKWQIEREEKEYEE